jgi:hypothetical protein
LIKGPGLYKLEGITGAESGSRAALRVWEEGESSSDRPEGGFFAALPLVLRSFRPGGGDLDCPGFKDAEFHGEIFGTPAPSVPYFQDTILAQDAAGPAALIGVSPRDAVMLWKRKTRGQEDFFFCGIGGIDAK